MKWRVSVNVKKERVSTRMRMTSIKSKWVYWRRDGGSNVYWLLLYI